MNAKIRIGRLNTLGCVLTELGRLYRHARRDQLDTQKAARLATILKEMRATLEASDIERRLEALEGLKVVTDKWGRAA